MKTLEQFRQVRNDLISGAGEGEMGGVVSQVRDRCRRMASHHRKRARLSVQGYHEKVSLFRQSRDLFLDSKNDSHGSPPH